MFFQFLHHGWGNLTAKKAEVPFTLINIMKKLSSVVELYSRLHSTSLCNTRVLGRLYRKTWSDSCLIGRWPWLHFLLAFSFVFCNYRGSTNNFHASHWCLRKFIFLSLLFSSGIVKTEENTTFTTQISLTVSKSLILVSINSLELNKNAI